MFEDSLVESTGRIRTRSPRYAAGSLVLQTALIAVLILIPYLYPDALPRKFLSVPLIAPPPATALTPVERVAATPVSHSEEFQHTLVAPPVIPTTIGHIVDSAPGPITGDLGPGIANGVQGAPLLGPITPPPDRRVHPAKPTGPLQVSSGVATGQLIVPIQPHYPAIALMAHVQGTVVVSALISTEGRIESLRVLSGPPLLVQAATDAIRQARYRPWTSTANPSKSKPPSTSSSPSATRVLRFDPPAPAPSSRPPATGSLERVTRITPHTAIVALR
jgi:periplasmic protein TonB